MPARKEIAWEVDSNGCHNCISHPKDDHGYAKCKRNSKNYKVHRYIYEQHHGEIPQGLVVRHKCDNPSCINIEHLELGTIADNNRDTIERGRHNYGTHENQKGEANYNARLTGESILRIKQDKTSTNKALGTNYGVHHSTISAIRLGKIWAHVV